MGSTGSTGTPAMRNGRHLCTHVRVQKWRRLALVGLLVAWPLQVMWTLLTLSESKWFLWACFQLVSTIQILLDFHFVGPSGCLESSNQKNRMSLAPEFFSLEHQWNIVGTWNVQVHGQCRADILSSFDLASSASGIFDICWWKGKLVEFPQSLFLIFTLASTDESNLLPCWCSIM